jgi:hypothetical protein
LNETILLSRLVEALGIFCFCCGSDYRGQKMAKELFQLLWALSQLRDNIKVKQEEKDVISVRRSVILTMLRMFSVLPADTILEDYGYILNDYMNWLSSVVQNDQDNECKELAANVISLLQRAIKQ